MSENKTRPTDASVEDYLAGVEPARRRDDAQALLPVMRAVTGVAPVMWGDSLIGFGQYHYHYKSGREGDCCRVGFAPRKANMAVHILCGFDGMEDLLAALGKHKTGVSCLYINKLADIDMDVLTQVIQRGWAEMARRYPE